MSLEHGRFWCWLNGIKAVCYSRKKMFSVYGASGIVLNPDDFLHIFGIVPKPGEAMLLDNRDWTDTCPKCGREMESVDLDPEIVLLCPHRCTIKEAYYFGVPNHARIITRKTLEENPRTT
jgi:hypothetical protein